MQVIGLSTEAQADAVCEEGLTTLDNFSGFDDERIKIICASVRKPGGLFPDPNAPAPVVGRGARNQNQAPHVMIANPGFKIPAICESRMKDAVYTAKYYEMIGMDISRDSLSADRILEFKVLKELRKNHKEILASFPLSPKPSQSPRHITYNLPDNHTRVTHLMNGITSNDTAIISAKTQILASPEMEKNFEAAGEFLLKCCGKIATSKGPNSHRVSAVRQPGKRKRDNNL